MTSKMVARLLSYKLGSPSYGDSKFEKWEEDCLAIFKPGLWQMGFFGCGKECMVTFSTGTIGE